MSVGRCRKCKKSAKWIALTCPHCGEQNPVFGRRVADWEIREEERASMAWAILVLVVFGLGLWMCFSRSDDPRFDALVACQIAAERKLVAPSSARFPGVSLDQIGVRGDHYFVNTYVDAQNSFGARLRSSVYCEVRVPARGPRQVLSVRVTP